MIIDLDTLLLKQPGYPLECIFNTLTPSSSRSDPNLQVALYFDLQTPELLHIATQLTHGPQHSNDDNDNNEEKERVVKIFVRKIMIGPQMVVFCNTREKLDWLAHGLQSQTSPLYINAQDTDHETQVVARVGCMYVDQPPLDRARAMQSFRQGEIRILLLTTPLTLSDLDVAQYVGLVVEYDLPQDQEVYLRRYGVNRWGVPYRQQSLVYISFVKGQEEMGLLRDIEAGIGDTVLEMPMNIEMYL
ncbi:Eukaryotic initiation factor 4A-III [Mortierella sp. GBA35]|nr:Eukaryotic initiation factor 4A-III [Mortierella sp. GBA35]